MFNHGSLLVHKISAQFGSKHCASKPLTAKGWPPAAVGWPSVNSELRGRAVEGHGGLTATAHGPPSPSANRHELAQARLFLPALLMPAPPGTVNPRQTAVHRLPACSGRGAPPVSAVTNSCGGQALNHSGGVAGPGCIATVGQLPPDRQAGRQEGERWG